MTRALSALLLALIGLASRAADGPVPSAAHPSSASSPAAHRDDGHGHAEAGLDDPVRLRLLVDAEQALAKGELDRAEHALETAANMAHAEDTELLQARAMMQRGAYGQALGFLAHIVGVHHDSVVPAALYAWLLHLGAQDDYAKRVLADARASAADDPVLGEIARRMDGTATSPVQTLLTPPARFAPYPAPESSPVAAPPPHARAIACGLLWEDGRHAVVAMDATTAGTQLWVRNGLGRARRARVLGDVPLAGVRVLELAEPLSDDARPMAARPPFGGSPGFVADFPPDSAGAPAWPRLRAGFFAPASATADARSLGIALPGNACAGGAVFDGRAMPAGLAVHVAGARDRFITVDVLRDALRMPAPAAPAASGASAMPALDTGYEQALRVALQVLESPAEP